MKSKLSAALAAVGAVAGMGRLRHLPIRQPWEYRMMRKSHFVLVALLLASTAANAASLNFQISEDNGAPTQFLNVLEFDRMILAWHRSNQTSKRLNCIPVEKLILIEATLGLHFLQNAIT